MGILANRHILITRDASQSGSLREQLERHGAVVHSVPTIKISDPDDWSPFDRAAGDIERFDWLIFTSPNAVLYTKKRLDRLGIDLGRFPRIKIAAVGMQTGRVVESFGSRVHLIPNKFQAEELSQKLIAEGVGRKKIWLPRALVARNVLIESLEKAGAEVRMTPVYQNRIPYENRELLIDTLNRHSIDWITFTSSSTVSHFFAILGKTAAERKLPKLASIGSITTETLHRLRLSPEFSAHPQNIEGLCQGIVDWETRHGK